MKRRWGELLLLIGVMVLLSAVTIFYVETADIDIEQHNDSGNNMKLNETELKASSGLLNQSINGLKMLYRDSSQGLKMFADTGSD
ncbi:MAG: hypothetical protein ACLFTA_00605 [Candidatus Nanohaloarchaea archaeon]